MTCLITNLQIIFYYPPNFLISCIKDSSHPSIFACIMRRKTIMNDIYNPSEDEQSNGNLKVNEAGIKNTSQRQGNSKTKKLLECHAFVCNSQADAIAIAAQLYQALVETIRKFNRHAEKMKGKNENADTINGNSSCRVRN